MDISSFYFSSAVMLGGLHALEPGHAKTLTAAYLIGTKGTIRDAILLGVSVATTHSIVVIGLSVGAVLLGRATFTDEATFLLAVGSSILVICLGIWLLSKRLRTLKRSSMRHEPHNHDHDHSLMSDDEHAQAHARDLPEYVYRGKRPSALQIITFGAAGGLIPCPAAISVMLLSLSLSQTGKGLVMVLGFSLGLALTLVGIGLLVVTGISKLSATGKFSRVGHYAPSLAAAMVIFSGSIGLLSALLGHR